MICTASLRAFLRKLVLVFLECGVTADAHSSVPLPGSKAPAVSLAFAFCNISANVSIVEKKHIMPQYCYKNIFGPCTASGDL